MGGRYLGNLRELGCSSRVAINLIFSCLLRKPNKPKKAKDVKLQKKHHKGRFRSLRDEWGVPREPWITHHTPPLGTMGSSRAEVRSATL